MSLERKVAYKFNKRGITQSHWGVPKEHSFTFWSKYPRFMASSSLRLPQSPEDWYLQEHGDLPYPKGSFICPLCSATPPQGNPLFAAKLEQMAICFSEDGCLFQFSDVFFRGKLWGKCRPLLSRNRINRSVDKLKSQTIDPSSWILSTLTGSGLPVFQTEVSPSLAWSCQALKLGPSTCKGKTLPLIYCSSFAQGC